MSRRKHVTLQSLTQDVQPPGPQESIVRALGTRGGNIVEVEHADGRATLVLMPARFNKKLWVRRGGYLIIDESQEAQEDASSRVTGTIVSVLYDEHVRQLQRLPGVWPAEFQDAAAASSSSKAGDGYGIEVSSDDGSGSGDEDTGAAAGGSGRDATAAAAAAAGTAATGGGGGDDDSGDEGDESSEDSLEPLHQNSNRRVIYYEVSDSEDEDEDEDEEDDDEAAPAAVPVAQRRGGGEAGDGSDEEDAKRQLPDEEVERTLQELGAKLTACELGKRRAE